MKETVAASAIGAKVTASAIIILHLTQTDFIVSFVGWFLRLLFDWYRARHKVRFRRQKPFSNRTYLAENWDRIVLSNIFGLGLLLILPEVWVLFGSIALNREVTWNSGISGLLGLLGFDVVSALLMGGKRRLTRLISGEESISLTAGADEGRDEAVTDEA